MFRLPGLRIVIILPPILLNTALAAPVTLDSSAIGASLNGRNSIGVTTSTTTRPYTGIGTQTALLPYLGFSSGNFYIRGLTPGYTLVNNNAYSIDILATPRFLGYSSDDSEQFQELESTDYSIHGGLSLSFNTNTLQFNAQLLTDLLNESNGTEILASVARTFSYKNVSFSPSIGINWQDTTLADHYYGVQAASESESLSAYTADSVINAQLSLTAGYSINDSVSTVGTLLLERYGDAISGSPLVENDTTTAITVGILYSF